MIYEQSCGGVKSQHNKNMSKAHVDSATFSPVTNIDLLTNILVTFISETPAESGWWHRMPTHEKGSVFPSDTLFPHIGTLLGLPDFIVCEYFAACAQ